MPVCSTEMLRERRVARCRAAIAVWQTAQAWLPGFGMWPGGIMLVFQSVVVWQPEQSPVCCWAVPLGAM